MGGYELEGMYGRLCLSVSRVGFVFFLRRLPVSHTDPLLSNNMAQLWAAISPNYSQVACKEELKMCNI